MNEFIARNGLIALDNSTITGSLIVTGGITGSLQGTASYSNNALSASYAANATSASYALTASFALNGGGGGGAAFPFTGNAEITGSLTVTDNVTVGGILTENSSLRYKKDIKTINNGLSLLLQLRGVRYTRKDNKLNEIGVIAEEINNIIPEIVLKNDKGQIDSVSYSRLSPIFIEAIKQLSEQVNNLSIEINKIKNQS
jgi:hypothetical protein